MYGRSVYVKNATTGELYKAGDTMKRPRLANTLEIIANQNASAFYTGVLAAKIVKEIRDQGGIITEEDLRDYQVDVQEALSVDLNNTYTAYTSQAPSSGPILTFILNILAGNERIHSVKSS